MAESASARIRIKRSRRARTLVVAIAALTTGTLQFLVPGVLTPKIADAAPSIQTSFPIFDDTGTVADGQGMATAMVSGPGGALWVNQARAGLIKITPAGSVSECPMSAWSSSTVPYWGWGYSYGYGIAVGPDGNLWATMQQTYVTSSLNSLTAGVIARVTPTCGVTYFPTPTASSFPYEIMSGPNGSLWFTEQAGDRIGAIATSGTMREFTVPTPSSSPTGITVGNDGNLWFTESGADKIGRMTPAGVFTEYPVSGGAHPHDIAAGSNGELWFTETGANAIGTMTTAGSGYLEYPIPTSGSGPLGIVSGGDGALWFAENNAAQVGRITTSGVSTEFATAQGPTINASGTHPAAPMGVATGPDQNIWYTDSPGNTNGTFIGRLPLVPCGDLTTSVSSQSNGSGVRDTPGSQESLQITLSNCGAPPLTGATTSTTVTPPSGCGGAPSIPSFVSTLSEGQSASQQFNFTDPACLGTYTVTTTTTMGTAIVAAATTYCVVSDGRGSHIVGDFNGDGYPDLAVADEPANYYAGEVDVYYGGPRGLDSRAPQVFTDLQRWIPSQLRNSGFFGFSLTTGDYTGDGYSDLAIGMPGAGGHVGQVIILRGSPSGLTSNGFQLISAPSGFTQDAEFGSSMASGDFNHDGYADIAISAPFNNGAFTQEGAVVVMNGSPGGLTRGTTITEGSPGMPGPGPAQQAELGRHLAVGDFNHDGYPDLVMIDFARCSVMVLYGSSAGLTFAGSQYLQPVGCSISFGGISVAVGDFNGNGYDDLAIGEPGGGTGGLVEVHYGGRSGLGTVAYSTAQKITLTTKGMPAEPTNRAGSVFGAALAAGDIKHNGRADLVVDGAPAPTTDIVLWGTLTKLTASGSRVAGDNSLDTVGLADFNADGYADLVVCNTGEYSAPTHTGCDVFNGSPTGTSSSPSYSFGQGVVDRWSLPGGETAFY